MLLSIIIPVYNIESYIEECLRSCIDQNIDSDSYEIIIVNDGSTDNSLNIAEQYKQKFNNIIIVNKENGGLSSARNAGLGIARGKYVWFIDGDDIISCHCLKDILKYTTEYDLDLLYINYSRITNNKDTNNTACTTYDFCEETYSGYRFFKNRQSDFLMVWRYIFKKSLFLDCNLRFCEGIIHEDAEFTHKAIYYAEKIGICHSVIYFYRISRSGSIMTEKKANLEKKSILTIINSIQGFRNTSVADVNYKKLLDEYLLQTVANYLAYRKRLYKISGRSDLSDIKKILDIKYRNIASAKKKIQLFAIRNCISAYSSIINIIYKS